MRPSKLGDAEIEYSMTAIKGWTRAGNSITKTFAFAKFLDGIAWIGKVAAAAERMDHHPDLDIRYTKVTATLSTHSAGGLTRSDFDLAKEMDALA
ncbi:MAG: 4a-hydroxytetrahydrobiopterin dehydratase [Gemmatimonadetes bacterium]|nr:4a-hydroxytetrahydrobiopterin dehydratase [Gemmatimonadota bacterium]